MTKLPEGSPFFTFGSCCFGKLVAGWTLPLFSFFVSSALVAFFVSQERPRLGV